MRLYFAIPSVVVALLFAALGVAAITRSWVLPWNRRHVRRVRLYGWGQLVAAVGLCCQVVFGLVISGIHIRQWGTMTGGVLLVTGLIVMVVAQRLGGKRQVSGTP
ncbi:hypothetical protein ACFP51_25640 [Streptomyces pratens]|uniref:Uncharacterized protein n=1 Tax=Streptomyces pratens TaxID=887456 RepID=A0ABW1M2Q5_9ACTN